MPLILAAKEPVEADEGAGEWRVEVRRWVLTAPRRSICTYFCRIIVLTRIDSLNNANMY